MAVVESPLRGLEALGVSISGSSDHLLTVDERELVEVVRFAQTAGQRVVIDGFDGEGKIAFSLIEQYLAPAAETTENLPPQCSF
jgi:hypothetical protein